VLLQGKFGVPSSPLRQAASAMPWSGAGKGKGKFTAKGKTEETPDWWEARGGGEGRGGGERRGCGERRGGGQGKGGAWRRPGCKNFLKNHRKMLHYTASEGQIELEQAESAQEQAQLVFAQAQTEDNINRFWSAAAWARNRSLNVERIAFKIRALDEDGVYVLTDDAQVVPLTDEEKQWNIEMRQQLATASVAHEHDEEDNAIIGASSATERERPSATEFIPPTAGEATTTSTNHPETFGPAQTRAQPPRAQPSPAQPPRAQPRRWK